MGRNGPTLHDVAEQAGVSIATVSRVARGIGDIAPGTRERVLAAIAEMGYRPNHLGRALVQRRHETLGIVFPGLRGPYYAEVIHGFEVEAVGTANSVLILGTELIPHATEQAIALADRADGVAIMGGSAVDDGEIARLARRGVPIVLLARDSLPGCPAIRVDNRQATRELTSHLLGEHGYRSLCFVGSIDGAPDAAERWLGFLDAHRDHGVSPPEAPIPVGLEEWAGAIAGHSILSQPLLPDAIVAANDEIAFGIASAAASRGIRIPEDLSLTGWDDIPLARVMTPSLTTVRQPMRELGAEAARALIALIDGQEIAYEDRILPTTVIYRASCGCRPASGSGAIGRDDEAVQPGNAHGKGGGDGP
ncbi:MAG: LacI family DNA-binding transcriptional regulator [Thermomicrobiales bacterium]|jgi:LacI family transcriptional regulator